MKKITTIFVFLTILISCKKTLTERVNQNDLRAYFINQMKEVDSTSQLQEFKLVKLDTTSLKNQYILLYNNMLSKSDEYNYEFDHLLEKVKSNRKLQSLSSGLDYTLYKMYKDDADDDLKKAKEYLKKDSLLHIDIEKVDKLINKSDSINPMFYVAKCYFIVKKKDKSTIKDTTFIRLDKELNILNDAEYKKSVKNIYKPISNFYEEW